MSSAIDTANFLVGEGVGALGGTSQWAIFVGEQPPVPNDCITVYDSGGTQGNPEGNLQDPTIQVKVRAQRYNAGYEKAEEVKDLLILPTDRIIGDWHYTGFWLLSDIQKIGKDANDRHLFTINFRLMREPSTSE